MHNDSNLKMKKLRYSCLLALCCLLALSGHSQIIQLVPGDVVRKPMVGIDTTTYSAIRAYQEASTSLLDLRANRITTLEHELTVAESASAVVVDELKQCRADNLKADAKYAKMTAHAEKALALPVRPPLLLDSRVYLGGGVGLLLGLFVGFIAHK
jgi:hypothetical protein